MKYLTLFSFILLIFLTPKDVYSQEIENISIYYQQILNDSDFIEAIEQRPDLFCCDSLVFLNNKDYEKKLHLLFRGKKLINKTEIAEINYPTLNYNLKKIYRNKYLLKATVDYSFRPHPGCITSKQIVYELKLKKTKRVKIKSKKIYARQITGKFL